MQPAAFGPLQGRADDQFRHGGNIAQFEQVCGDDEIPVILVNFLLQIGDAFLGALESFVGSGDPVYDLVVLTLWHHDKLDAVLAGYEPDDRMLETLNVALTAYQQFRHVGSAVWLVNHGYEAVDDVRRAADRMAEADQNR